jgi:hypothetical protein
MDTCLLQDWITVGAHDTGGPTSVIQSAHQYVDLGQFEDLVFYLDVRKYTGSVAASYETSPTRQDSSFLPMLAPITLAAIGLRVDKAFFSTAAVPPARYVRWRLSTGGGAWSATLRIWMTAYKFC